PVPRRRPSFDATQPIPRRRPYLGEPQFGRLTGAPPPLPRRRPRRFISATELLLPDLIEALWLRFGPYLRMISKSMAAQSATAGFANWSDHHRQLVAALDGGDGPAAVAAIEADVRNTCSVIFDLVADI
ncbi:MAG: hypothetical protein AAFW98_12430, partial [Pseudomonadota bacterium]